MLDNTEKNEENTILAGITRFKLEVLLKKDEDFRVKSNFVIQLYKRLSSLKFEEITRDLSGFSFGFNDCHKKLIGFQREFFEYKRKYASLPTRKY